MSRAALSLGVASAASCSRPACRCRPSFQFLPDDAAAGLQRGLVRHVLGQGRLQLDQVVGEEAGARVADLELDGLGAPRHFRLLAQRRELPPDFAGEVAEPLQVGLHGLEFADRLFLAAAVLEDAGGLLDEAAPVLRGGVQHLVQLPLPHDHVHFPAQAGVGQEFLDVQQPAAGAVDGVLRAAGAEQGAGDRDFAVVDRQGAVAVVDGEGDVGAAQRRAAGRAGEDDVLHLAAAKGLGALLAHHPGQGVHHIGLAGAVGAHHGGDAGFEFEGRRRSERLESPDGQAFEVQGVSVLLAGGNGCSCPKSTATTPNSADLGFSQGNPLRRFRAEP